MVKMSAIYTGEKHCTVEHGPSGAKLDTDAPKDNQGKGESFSPTDLVATALGTCILTTIAINAEREGLDVKGSRMSVEKVMASDPRRISSLKTIVELPRHLTAEQRSRMESIGRNCPVMKSIHPDISAELEFRFTL